MQHAPPPVVPPPARPGDRVRIVRVAGRAPETALQSGAARLRSAGYDVVLRPAPGPHDGAPYLAGTDEDRLGDLLDAITDPSARAIVCARGGYGATRLLDALPDDALRAHPRWLVGYSDITALHLWAWRQGVASLHAPMPAGFDKHAGDGSVEALLAMLADPRPPSVEGLHGHGGGQARGMLVGGNLSLLASLIGTRWLPSLDGLVLLIEEIGEPPYRMDRMLTSLLTDGRAQGLRGVVFGQLTGCTDATHDDDAALARVIGVVRARFAGPIVSGLQAGHGTPNDPLMLGVAVVLDADAGTLKGIDDPHARAVLAPRAARRPADDPASLLARAIDDGVCSGAQLEAWHGDTLVTRIAMGATATSADAVARPVTERTLFDIASVTKAVCTAILAMQAVERGAVQLDERAPAQFSAARATLRDLLRHASGLPAHREVFRSARDADAPRAAALDAFAAIDADAPGRPVYSDVGFIALGRWLEHIDGASLDAQFDARIAGPLGLQHTRFGDGSTPLDAPDGVAATEWCPWRQRTLQGVVHDENAQVLGGACGHAGLFSTASDVAMIARSLLGHGPAVLSPGSVATMWDPGARHADGTWVLGWDTPSGAASNAGSLLSRAATVGHLGFTGTSVWIDRQNDVVIVLLTNRVHPTRDDARIRQLRPAIHDAVARRLPPWEPR